jgi:diguanylate cyclase (GGDEF)-like protein
VTEVYGSGQIARLRAFFARQPDPYAEADRDAGRMFGGLLFLLQAALVAALSPLTPPTEAIGVNGWVLLGEAVVVFALIGEFLIRHGDRVSDNQALALNYLAVAALAGLIWLAGGYHAAYLPVFLLWVVLVPASHPPRRAVTFLAFVLVAAATPLMYEGWERAEAARLIGQAAVWLVLAATIIFRVQAFRQQRIDLSRGQEDAMRMAVTDPLTGLANRRAFGEVLEREVARAGSEESPLSLVIADIDGFKAINDRHGHVKGDQYLRQMAETISAMLRENDLGFRWGGDEFAILLPGTSRQSAEVVCERLGGVVAAAVEGTAGVRLSLSFGLAEYLPGMSADDLVGAADLDLMEGKAGAGAGSPD